jgi:putative intracellular protease/amidase
METVNVLLYNNFTTLDAIGPIEVLSRLNKEFSITYASMFGGLVTGTGNAAITTVPVSEIAQYDVLLVPGGLGTRTLVNDELFLDTLRSICQKSKVVLAVCTGSALLAKAGVLENLKATSNKLAWSWVTAQNDQVQWIRTARWVLDGKFYTSSGITAGIDMALGFLADKFGRESAEKAASSLEYIWNRNKDNDPFA